MLVKKDSLTDECPLPKCIYPSNYLLTYLHACMQLFYRANVDCITSAKNIIQFIATFLFLCNFFFLAIYFILLCQCFLPFLYKVYLHRLTVCPIEICCFYAAWIYASDLRVNICISTYYGCVLTNCASVN